MKKITQILSLGVLLLVVSSTQLSAQKCKFDYDKKDPITGEQTKKITLKINMAWYVGFNEVEGKYFISMDFFIPGNNIKEFISPENTVIFKLTNGELITLHANDNYIPTIRASESIVSVYNAKYDISKEDLQKLATYPLAFIRMGIGSGKHDIDREIKAKEGVEFQNNAKCILQ